MPPRVLPGNGLEGPVTRPPATIRDVARDARVAVSTVSRVINDSGATAPDTRLRVLAAAEKLGYRPSGMARALRNSRTMTIGVFIPDLENPVFLQWLRGAENAAQDHGYSVLTCDGQSSVSIIEAQLARLYERRVDGLVLAGQVPARLLRDFIRARIPFEPRSLLGAGGEPPRLRLERAAQVEAARALIALGHRRVAFFTRDNPLYCRDGSLPMSRFGVIRQTLREAGGVGAEASVVQVSTASAAQSVREVMAAPGRPTALVAGTHILAPFLLAGLYEQGLFVPDDVSFLSFGDSPWALAHRPPISVIRHDYEAEARAVMERLIARVEECESHLPAPPVPSEFVQRGSIGPAPR